MEKSGRTIATRIAVGAALLALLALAPAAVAGKGGSGKGGGGRSGGSSATPPDSTLSMTWQAVMWNPKQTNTNCLTEDDADTRIFSGSLFGSYSTSYQLCDPNTDGTNAGGIGLQSDVWVAGQLSDLTITAPDGSVRHAVFVGQDTSKGVTSSHYVVCQTPPYFVATNTGGDPLQGGTWQMTLSGQISSASWTTRARMTDAGFQQTFCPPSQQNLIS